MQYRDRVRNIWDEAGDQPGQQEKFDVIILDRQKLENSVDIPTPNRLNLCGLMVVSVEENWRVIFNLPAIRADLDCSVTSIGKIVPEVTILVSYAIG